MPRILIEKDRCKGCELCVHACPQNILAIPMHVPLGLAVFAGRRDL